MNRSTMIMDGLNRLNEFFGNKQSKGRLKVYYEKLITLQVCPESFLNAVERLVEQENMFPSISKILDLTKRSRGSEELFVDEFGFTKKQREQYDRDMEIVLKVEKEFKKHKKSIDSYVTKWAILNFGKDFPEKAQTWGISMNFFKVPALIDLHEAEFNLDSLNLKAEKRLAS